MEKVVPKIKVDPSIRSEAIFSECKTYRYLLARERDRDLADDDLSRGTVNFLLCNPSVASVEVNDPRFLEGRPALSSMASSGGDTRECTLRIYLGSCRLIRRVLESWPIRSVLKTTATSLKAVTESDLTICGWGDVGARYKRPGQVMKMLADHGLADKLYCLGTNDSAIHSIPFTSPTHSTRNHTGQQHEQAINAL